MCADIARPCIWAGARPVVFWRTPGGWCWWARSGIERVEVSVERRLAGSVARWVLQIQRCINCNEADEVITHLRQPGTDLVVKIEIEATDAAGFDESEVRTVSENAKTLKFDQSGFEET